MANVSTRTANWRLFGGGGLAIGGLLWTLHVVLAEAGILSLGPWVRVVAFIIITAALIFVALGETGSNGAVGSYLVGKLALFLYAAGFLLLAVNAFASLGTVVTSIAAVLIIVGGLGSAYAIYRKGVAKGAARWILFVAAVVGALWAVGVLGVTALAGLWWLALAFAVLVLVTGVLYLFNDRKLG